MRYKPVHFDPWELVPPLVYRKLGSESLLVMDERILMSADTLRGILGRPITVNDWRDGGVYDQRGFRTDSTGAVYSQHRYGRALDCNIAGMDAEEARQYIIKNPKKFPYITRLELGVTWLHIDCAPVDGLTTFKAGV